MRRDRSGDRTVTTALFLVMFLPILGAVTAATANIKRDEEPAAELIDVRGVAALLDCSPRHVYRLADAGRMPRPLKLGALVRWRRQELLEWLSAGCPAVDRRSRP